MSLINDALKRAKQSQQQEPQSPPPVPPLPPVESTPRGNLAWFFPVAILLLVATACFFIFFAFFITRKPVAQVAMTPQNTQAAAVALPIKMLPPGSNQTVAVVTPKPAPPALKIQGIFYSDAKWQAIVNGQSVLVGDSVNGFRVKLISKNDILFIAPDGTEKTLALGD